MLYVDADALSKLAHWNMLPLLPELTGYSWSEIATISSLKHRAARAQEKPDGKLFHSTDAAQAACSCISLMGQLPNHDVTIMAKLSELQQIDSGEALLLATVVGDTNGCFLTGDKRALRELSRQYVAPLFAHKILIIEQLVLRCLEFKGRDWVLLNICPYKQTDKAISMILGSGCDGSMESITEGVFSYINEIEGLCYPSLLAA